MSLDLDRRTLLAFSALATAGSGVPVSAEDARTEHIARMAELPPDAPLVAMLIHPRMVALDLVGPLTVFTILRCRMFLVWKDKAPVSTDIGLPLTATHTFGECPSDLDVLMVPGGILGSVDCMNDTAVMSFLAERGSRAKWVTSVCTGGLTLAAAGLLTGYDATAHWAVADLLPLMGARHIDKRVVIDRNRMTGGGVTAGINLALTLADRLRGEEAARAVQLTMEYAPEPPLRNGTPAEAGPERVAAARASRAWMDGQARLAAEAAGKRLGIRLSG
ncbi:MAG: DJ-1/PfpI family protein [Novosphingobium sp.]